MKFDKDKRIPERNKYGIPSANDLLGMKAGESFLVRNCKYQQIAGYINGRSRMTGYKFTLKQDGDGMRVWRKS